MENRLVVEEEDCLDVINFVAAHEETMEKDGVMISQTMIYKNDLGKRRLSIRPIKMDKSQAESFSNWLKENGFK